MVYRPGASGSVSQLHAQEVKHHRGDTVTTICEGEHKCEHSGVRTESRQTADSGKQQRRRERGTVSDSFFRGGVCSVPKILIGLFD